jgi:hypothetical protein
MSLGYRPCLAAAALVLMSSCGGSSAPVIVSGKIETHGDSVGVAVYRGSDKYESDPIDYRESEGDFELRGIVSVSDARDLFLAVFTPTLSYSCSTTVNLPPLRLSEEGWVNAGTGEPVVLSIELHPRVTLGAPCPQ